MPNDEYGYGGASRDNSAHQNPDLPDEERSQEGNDSGEARGFGRPNYAGSRYAGARGGQAPGRISLGGSRGVGRRGPRAEGEDNPRHRGGGPSRRQSGGPSHGHR